MEDWSIDVAVQKTMIKERIKKAQMAAQNERETCSHMHMLFMSRSVEVISFPFNFM